MAPTHGWFDTFIDLGWLHVLTPAAMRLIFTLARRVDRSLQTQIKLRRLQDESGLPARTFHLAKRELYSYGLLRRDKPGGKWTLTLSNPVPGPPDGAISRTKRCNPLHKRVQPIAQSNRQTPTEATALTDSRQQIKAQLEGAVSNTGVSVNDKRASSPVPAGGERLDAATFLRGLGITTEEHVLLQRVQHYLDLALRYPDRLEDMVLPLSRFLQARSLLIPEDYIRTALQPNVRQALAVFGGVLKP